MQSRQIKLSHLTRQFTRLFASPTSDHRIKQLYHNWVNYNTPYYTKYYLLLAILIYVLLIPLDFLWFENGIIYTRHRIIFISALLLIVFIFSNTIKQSDDLMNNNNYSLKLWLMIPSLLMNLQYIYFLSIVEISEYFIVLLACFFLVLISTLFMYRFKKEQILINILSSVVLLILPFYRQDLGHDCNRLIFFHGISAITALYYRNQFIGNLMKRYEHLCSLVPRRIAQIISITDGKVNINNIFKTQERYTVCLCADWRNYQLLTQQLSYEKLSELTEKFYDIIFDKLDNVIPDGDYFVDWNADELFIIFYSTDSSNTAIREKSLNFAHSLSTDIYMEISSVFDINLKFDIGLSCGTGLLGLQGPKNLKKTTLTGETAGIAKRLETQAKSIRNNNTDIPSFPQIIMDSKLNKTATQLQIFKKHNFQKLQGTEKNIMGDDYYLWQFDGR